MVAVLGVAAPPERIPRRSPIDPLTVPDGRTSPCADTQLLGVSTPQECASADFYEQKRILTAISDCCHLFAHI